MLSREQIIALVKTKGPVLPSQLTKELNTTPMFVSAILSELVDKGLLRLSSAKVGGSPLYYLEGQEPKLAPLLYPYLHEKEKKAFDSLKSKGILRDRAEEPVIRVALRAIKDFAIPLEVKKGDDIEYFWKFFLVSDADAEKEIRAILTQEIGAEKKTSTKWKKSTKQPPKSKQRKKNDKKLIKGQSKTSSKKQSQKTTNSKKKINKKLSKSTFNTQLKNKKKTTKKSSTKVKKKFSKINLTKKKK